MKTYKFRLYPSRPQEEDLLWTLDKCRFVYNQMLEYKAESAGVKVVRVDPRGTSKEYKFGKLDRDYNASLNILLRGLSGQGLSSEPVEIEPLRELIRVPASSIVEAGSQLPKQ